MGMGSRAKGWRGNCRLTAAAGEASTEERDLCWPLSVYVTAACCDETVTRRVERWPAVASVLLLLLLAAADSADGLSLLCES